MIEQGGVYQKVNGEMVEARDLHAPVDAVSEELAQPLVEGDDLRDYRDELRELIDRNFERSGTTRYRICKEMGIDSGTLSNVLAKRRHFSLDKLTDVLRIIGYKMVFQPANRVPQLKANERKAK